MLRVTTFPKIWLISLIILLNSTLIDSVSAGTYVWTSNGPVGVKISVLAIDPTSPTTLYAGTDGNGVFKSTNGGQDWNAVNNGLTDFKIMALALNPSTPAILYVGTHDNGVFKSVNSGESWYAVNTNLSCPYIFALAIDPAIPSTLYAGTLCGMFKSVNGGGNWSAINTGLPDTFVFALAVDPLTPATIYAGTEYNRPSSPSIEAEVSGESVFKSIDGGATWSAANSGLPEHARVHSLAIDPLTPSILYVGISVGGVGVYKTTDGGANWTEINTGLPTYGNIVISLAIDPVTSTTLYAGTDNYGVYKSTNGGTTWSASKTGLNTTNVQALAVNMVTPTTLYAGASGDGIFKSNNSGSSWQAANSGLPAASISALAIDPILPTTIYAGSIAQVYKSADSSEYWQNLNALLPYGAVNSLAIDPQEPTTLFAGVGDTVCVSTNGGEDWGFYFPSLGNDVLSLVIDPAESTTVYAGTYGSGVFKKTSDGNWNPINTGLNNLYVHVLVIDPITSTTLYVGTDSGVFKSIDGGKNWHAIATGLTNSVVLSLAIDPISPTSLFAGTSNGIFKTLNAGENWSTVNTGLPNEAHVIALAIDPTIPTTLYAGIDDGGVFRSLNSGGNWDAFNAGLINLAVHSLAIAPMKPAVLYVGTDNGVFSIQTGTPDTIVISGNVDMAGTNLNYTDGTLQTVTADNSGNYLITVPFGWSGIVKPLKTGYVFAPVSRTYSNVTTNQVFQDYTAKVGANVDVYIGSGTSPVGNYSVAQGEEKRLYYNLSGGPVKVTSDLNKIVAAIRLQSLSATGDLYSFVETMGVPSGLLSDKYYFPTYNNTWTPLNSQIRFANLGSATTRIRVTIGKDAVWEEDVPASEERRLYLPVSGGPVIVESLDETKIVAAIRLQSMTAGGTLYSFAETKGIPKEKLSDKYYFPTYNNTWGPLNSQVRFGNLGAATTRIRVTIGKDIVWEEDVPAGEERRLYFPVSGGPVVVESLDGTNIVAAIRLQSMSAAGELYSFVETMGVPYDLLSDKYYFPTYNNTWTPLNSQIRFANLGLATTRIRVTIGGNNVWEDDVPVSEERRLYFAMSGGPVIIESLDGTKIVGAIRLQSMTTSGTLYSFAETMGIPKEYLSDTYYFPTYNNTWAPLNSQLRFGVP